MVFKNAVAALPARLAFRARFLNLLRRFDYGFVRQLLDQVYDSVARDFPQVRPSELYWGDSRAVRTAAHQRIRTHVVSITSWCGV